MANTRRTATKVVKENIEIEKTDDVVQETVSEPETEAVKAPTKRKVKEDIPLNTMVKVVNGTYGQLIYKSKKNTGMKLVWSKFGDDEFMELSELLSARNTDRRFFEQNWWLIEDEDVLQYLGVAQYYQNTINLEDFEHLFTESAKDIAEKVSAMSDGLKRTVAARAYELIEAGEIDSRSVIQALKESTGYDLMD